MKLARHKVPVLVLNCKLGGLAIMRSLGSLGIPLYGVDADAKAPGLLSRYCRREYIREFDESRPIEYLEFLRGLGKGLGKGTILIPTSDELSIFVAEQAEALKEYFVFPDNTSDLVRNLASKEGMYHLARKHAVPSPFTEFPKSLDDVLAYLESARLPIMLKGIYGNRLEERSGKKMVLVRTKDELIEVYKSLEDPDHPNLMLQEYIPGGDDQIYIFNGYFDHRSDCLCGFTGHKIRQFPVHVGCASLGVCRWNEEVAVQTTTFMKNLGYKGILDIGYRWDERDGLYKVLDINPRIGQAFRLFVSRNGMDVARSLYLDLTGQEQVHPITSREGRRWMIEDFDIISSYHYYKEGDLTVTDWIKSFRNLEEGAWFRWNDPVPFFKMTGDLGKKFYKWLLK
ncbi:MAG: hypothetical protein WC899_01020 [bacterium]|jgi:predicted ATP-grasp superfamily ATP-dependent carboligase